MVSINDLLSESIHHILSYLEPESVCNCLITHRLFHVLTEKEKHLNQLRYKNIIELTKNRPTLVETISICIDNMMKNKEIYLKYTTQKPQPSPELKLFLLIGNTIYNYLCRINELLK